VRNRLLLPSYILVRPDGSLMEIAGNTWLVVLSPPGADDPTGAYEPTESRHEAAIVRWMDTPRIAYEVATLQDLLLWASRRIGTQSICCNWCGDSQSERKCLQDPQSCLGHLFDRVLIREALQAFVDDERFDGIDPIDVCLFEAKAEKQPDGYALLFAARDIRCFIMGLKPGTLVGDDPMPYTEEP
jgi:hypothetical protein